MPNCPSVIHHVALGKAKSMTDRLITIEDLCQVLGGISRATLYRHLKALADFPKPLKIGKLTRFRESEVQAYIRAIS